MKKLLFILMIIPFLSIGQSKIRNTQITSGNNPNETFLKSDGATNAVWDSVKISSLKIDTTLNLKEYSIIARGQRLPLSNGACQISTLTDNGNGSVTLGNGDYHLASEMPGHDSKIYSLSGGTWTMTDQSQNYIVADYNSGTPYIHVITDVTLINETTIVPIYSIYRNGNYLHTQNWDALGVALANKLHQSIVKTQRYRRESGLILSEYGTHNLNLSIGRIWTGAVPITLDAIATATDNLFFFRHIAGVWTPNIQTTYNFTHYDNGTDLIELTANRYAVNWVFRGVESQKHLYIVAGTGDYTESQAITATLPAIPIAISSHAVLVAKLIVQKNAATALSIQSAFDTQFGLSAIQSHGDLTGRDVVDSHPSGAITNTPSGTITATDNQTAINQLDAKKEPTFSKGNLVSGSSQLTINNGTSRLVGGTATLTVDLSGYAPASGSGNYIWNGTTPQSASFSVNGTGLVGTGTRGVRLGGFASSYGSAIYMGADAGSTQRAYRLSNQYSGAGTDFVIDYASNDLPYDTDFTTHTYVERFRLDKTGSATFASTIQATTAKLTNLTGTVTRLTTAIADGTLGVINNGTNGQVLKIVSGVPAFADESGTETQTTTVQTLSGTTPTFNTSLGFNATLTMSGNTTITFSNIPTGSSGWINITNAATLYTLDLTGYNFKITQNIYGNTGYRVGLSGGSQLDRIGWSYDGSVVVISGSLDLKP